MPRRLSDDPKNVARRARYSESPENLKLAASEYRDANRVEVNGRRRANYTGKTDEQRTQARELHDTNPKLSVYNNAFNRAKKKGLEFTITKEDFDIPLTCPYLKIPIFRGDGIFGDNSPSLDRVDVTKGYVPGNVEVISYKANRMKNDGTLEELVVFAQEVLRRFE